MTMKIAVGFLAVLLFSPSIPAQTADDGSKQREERKALLISQAIADIPNLRLAENRAVAYARAGSAVWTIDQKSALAFFQNAASELINAQTLAESNRKSNQTQDELLTGGATRPIVLNAIASRNAEMALELLVKTRPAEISRALAYATLRTNKISGYGSNNSYLAQNELNLEHAFGRMAAEQNPARAEKLLRDSLAKGLSGETLALLKKLSERNRSSAVEIASEIVNKLLAAKFVIDGQPNHQPISTMVSFLTDFAASNNPDSPSQQMFAEPQMRQLAARLISHCLEFGPRQGLYIHHSVIPIAERFVPSAVERLKSIAETGSHRGFIHLDGLDPESQKLMTNATGDQLAAAARKYSGNSRHQLLNRAAQKYVQEGRVESARDLVSDNFADTAHDEAMRNLDNQYSLYLIGQGRFEEAERLIEEMAESWRVGALVGLANTAFNRDAEKHKSYALSVLVRARGLIGDKPDNSTELGSLMLIVGAYMNIEPMEAFNIYESLLPQMNELSDAAAVISSFQGSGNVRNGEFLISQGNPLGFYGAEFHYLRSLSEKDFDRTVRIIDGLSRREARISFKLQLAEQY